MLNTIPQLNTLDNRLSELDGCATDVMTTNDDNVESSADDILERLGETREYDAFVEGRIAGAQKAVGDFKEKLVQVSGWRSACRSVPLI